MMKHIKFQIMAVASAMMLLLASCNKDLEQFPETPVTPDSGPTLNEAMASNTSDSLYYKMLKKIGLDAVLADSTKAHTLFVPSNTAIKPVLSGLAAQAGVTIPVAAPDAVFAAFIEGLPAAVVGGLVSYNTVPQKLLSTSIGSSFPNFVYPTILNPSPTTEILLGPVLRLALYPSTANGAWLNNVPIVGVDQMASNGVIHHTASMLVPPTQYLWDRISSDPDLTILKAAVQRADSAGPRLVPILSQFGPSFTLFAPTNLAFKQLINVLSGGQVPVAAPDAVFISFLNSNYVSTNLVAGVLLYHVLDGQAGRPGRAFMNNFPAATAASYPTLFNSIVPSHPGIALKVALSPTGITGATVKGAVNPSASNITYNPLPGGTSDQNYLNGVLHKIDQVLLPITP